MTMGSKKMSATSQTDFADAFQRLLDDNPPTGNTPREYVVSAWKAQVGGVVGAPLYTVEAEVSGGDVD
jgi:hypothetical protein